MTEIRYCPRAVIEIAGGGDPHGPHDLEASFCCVCGAPLEIREAFEIDARDDATFVPVDDADLYEPADLVIAFSVDGAWQRYLSETRGLVGVEYAVVEPRAWARLERRLARAREPVAA